jgi:outer membrane receptor protein involved in Fe transport
VVYNDLAQFTFGSASTATADFPVTQKERIAQGDLDLYAMDTVKAGQRWTLVAGLRATWNTNPVNEHGLFARPPGSFLDMAHSIDQPLNQAIETNVRSLFAAMPLFSWQPRASAAYKLSDTLAAESSTTLSLRRLPTWARPMLRLRRFLWAASTDRWAASALLRK